MQKVAPQSVSIQQVDAAHRVARSDGNAFSGVLVCLAIYGVLALTTYLAAHVLPF
ncbi:MAG: hypothetical protein ACI9C1_003294 [Candidatus Aldehydirespiratoraceae bacterium]|jgi:hypothetical protein